MLDQERTDVSGGDECDAPQIASNRDGNERRLRPNGSSKAVEAGVVHHLPTADFAGVFVRVPTWKRVLDVSCVLVAIPSLLPLILIVLALIKLTSKGPILFKQERVGLLGRRFTLFKFRTMFVGADTTAHQSHVAKLMDANQPMTKLDRHGDKRLIPVGRLLRVLGIDELPQLINVLRGEMSIVGPRPCLPNEYSRYLPAQKERLHALPGLTGLWQVSGKNRLTFNQMIECDIRYVRTQSPWLDLAIMFKTIPALAAEVRESQDPAPPDGPAPAERSTESARCENSISAKATK